MDISTFVEEWFTKPDFRMGRFGDGRRYSSLEMDNDSIYSYGKHFPMIVINNWGYPILNGDRYSSSTTGHQSTVRWATHRNLGEYVEIPYSALVTMGLIERSGSFMSSSSWDIKAIKKLNILDSSEDTVLEFPYIDPKTGEEKVRKEHLLGGCLFRVGRRYFLSSTDSSAHWRFGYFLTELPSKVETMEEAFYLLKPDVVKQAEEDNMNVERQGEWFFVERGNAYTFRPLLKPIAEHNEVDPNQLPLPGFRKRQRTFKLDQFIIKNHFLPTVGRVGNGHHRVRDMIQLPDGRLMCRGTVRHINNEHKMLKLGETWWEAYSNTQIMSVGAIGRID